MQPFDNPRTPSPGVMTNENWRVLEVAEVMLSHLAPPLFIRTGLGVLYMRCARGDTLWFLVIFPS